MVAMTQTQCRMTGNATRDPLYQHQVLRVDKDGCMLMNEMITFALGRERQGMYLVFELDGFD